VAQYIYVLEKARKAHGDKVVLDNVTLSFLPGAKIGVVGPNGAGKSSLLKIMAGLDRPSNGEARLMPGYTVGMLQQEPPLSEGKTVLGNIEEAVAETKAKLARFNEVAELLGTDYSDALMDEMGRLQEELDHADAWDIDSKLALAMDALRCPPPDADVSQLSGPTCCCSTSPPTTSTPRVCSGWSSTCRSTPAPSSPSPTIATSSTTSRSGSPRSTAARCTATRATTRRIWRRRPSAWR
jgi:energy-coupling factor transporter ATP-binding protein EcfA2